MSEQLSIEWHGCDGSVWHVSGEAVEEEGVLLLPKPTRIYDAPASTFWVKGGMKQVYQGMEYTRRDPILGFQIYAEDIDEWEDRDSRFRKSWDYDDEGYLLFRTDGGERRLYLRLLQEPEAYGGAINEGGLDPHIWGDSALIVTAAAENPFFEGVPAEIPFVAPNTSGNFTVPIMNDGDVEMWPQWTASATQAGIKWSVPDYSWGSAEYNRAVADATRKWTMPALRANEHVDAMSDPSEELIISSLDTNVWNRCVGNGLLYPVPRYTKQTNITGSYTGAKVGDSIMLSYTPRYTRPWGVSL